MSKFLIIVYNTIVVSVFEGYQHKRRRGAETGHNEITIWSTYPHEALIDMRFWQCTTIEVFVLSASRGSCLYAVGSRKGPK